MPHALHLAVECTFTLGRQKVGDMNANEVEMPVTAFVHGRPAVHMEANPHRPLRMEPTANANWLSSDWLPGDTAGRFQMWLLCALPENGVLEKWLADAGTRLQESGVALAPRLPEGILWAHAQSEFCGALSIEAEGQTPSAPAPAASYPLVQEHEIESLLRDAVSWGNGAAGRRAVDDHWPSLSGMRPKTSLTWLDGQWRQAPVGQLNNVIVKVEDSRADPGAAGVESVCQNALKLAGLRAAKTRSRVLCGHQCVLSVRADRRMAGGRILPVHQEDYRQAGDWGLQKLRQVAPRERPQGWVRAYELLANGGADAEAECDALTGFLAASWLLCHSDIHRGNLGFNVSAPGDGPKRVALAPAYDASSSCGTSYVNHLAFGVAGQSRVSQIGPRNWLAHARECGVDGQRTLDVVAAVVDRMPDALSQAISACAQQDENKEGAEVARRAREVERHVAARCKEFKRSLRQDPKLRRVEAASAPPEAPSP